jgi:hypothetical protein
MLGGSLGSVSNIIGPRDWLSLVIFAEWHELSVWRTEVLTHMHVRDLAGESFQVFEESAGQPRAVSANQVELLSAGSVLLEVDQLLRADEEGGLAVTSVGSIRWLTLESSNDVLSDYVHLMEGRPERLGDGEVHEVADSVDVVVLSSLKSDWIDVQETVFSLD